MDLGLANKRALLVGGRTGIARACAGALLAEGAAVACEAALAGRLGPTVSVLKTAMLDDPVGLAAEAASALGGVDIVIAVLDLPAEPSIGFDDDEGEVTAAWDALTAMSALYQAAAPQMKAEGFGRFIWTGPIEARQLGAHGGDIDTVVGLGALGLHKVISGEMGPFGVTANAVLWDRAAADEATLAETVGASVAWLASEPAAYITGFVLAVDAGRSQGLF
jgi:3-oxoacyl-[acyl-carrier protein] reductase